MNDFLWYSRFAIWVGAIILLIEAVTARSGGPVTVIAVLCLLGGLIGFVIALAVSGRREAASVERTGAPESDQEEAG